MKKICPLLAFLMVFISCGKKEEKEDILNEVSRDGTVQSDIKVEHLNDSADVLITRHLVWKDGANIKNIVTRDTIPALGNEEVLDDKENKQTVKRGYDIFITVK